MPLQLLSTVGSNSISLTGGGYTEWAEGAVVLIYDK